jgi:heterodisulfide reductase subunit C
MNNSKVLCSIAGQKINMRKEPVSEKVIYPDDVFLGELKERGIFQAEACFQCRKCTTGCPVTFAMDLFPDEVIRLVILGQRKTVLSSKTIWVCTSCETCTTRCPNEVKIAELMDQLKEIAIQEDIPCPHPTVRVFHESFLNNVKSHGRVFESTFLPHFFLRSGLIFQKFAKWKWFADAKLGLKMFFKGKFPIFPKRTKGKKEVREILK